MNKTIINLIKNKDWKAILNYTKVLADDERYITIKNLKEINIDADIIKASGNNLSGQEREDYYKNRRELSFCYNYFLVTCIRNFSDLEKVETKYEYYIFNPFYDFISNANFEALIALYKVFPPNYLDQVIKSLAKHKFKNFNFQLLWNLYENKWVTFDEAFFVRTLFNLQGFDNNHFKDAHFLMNHPTTIEDVFLKFYKYEIPILDLIKAESIEYNNGLSAKANVYWYEVFKILIENNAITTRNTVTNLFESLLNNWKKPHLDWHVRLLDLFEPTPIELLANQQTLFAILGKGQNSLINYAIQLINTIYKDEKFDSSTFFNNLPIIFSNDKIVKSLLISLDIIEQLLLLNISIDINYRDHLSILLMHSDAKLQEKVANLLIKYFNDKDLNMVVAPYTAYLKQKTRAILKITIEDQDTIENTVVETNSLKSITPIANWEELLLHIGTCIRTKSPADFDLFFEGLNQLQFNIPIDYDKQLKPYIKQFHQNFSEFDTLLHLGLFINCWASNSSGNFYTRKHQTVPFLAKKAELLLVKLKEKNNLPFLSTPSHEPFYIHPHILIDRLLMYEANNKKVDLEDLIVACNRTLLQELQNDYKEKATQIKTNYAAAIHYFFGITNEIKYNLEDLPLWTQITRIKDPTKKFTAFENTNFSEFPAVVNPFNIKYKVVIDKNEWITFYRLILDNNWNYQSYLNKNIVRQEYIYHNTASVYKARKNDIAYQLSLNPYYIDPLICRYIPNVASKNEVDVFEECLYPMQYILTFQLKLHHSGWIYVAACLLFEKNISRDLASEYIFLAIARGENLDFLATVISQLINERFAPINRFIEFLDKPNHQKELKLFQLAVLSKCILNFDKNDLPINSKKIIEYYKELNTTFNSSSSEEIKEKLNTLKK